MKNFKVGDVWEGKSHVDMINKVMGTNYKGYMKCTVNLQKFGKSGIAWFVNMDGSEHGLEGYKWVNRLSSDGTTIYEACVESDEKTKYKLLSEISKSYRLCFQLDPDGIGNRYKCKFVGFFKLIQCFNNNMNKEYKKLSDTFSI